MPEKSSAKRASVNSYHYEFGGVVGAAAIILLSHTLPYYIYYVLHHNNCAMWFPASLDDLSSALTKLSHSTALSWKGTSVYFSFLGLQLLLAFVMPGLTLKGRPDEAGHVLEYRCNALASWYFTLALCAILAWTGTLQLSALYDNMGSSLTAGLLFADALSLIIYFGAFLTKSTHRMSGKHIYDFFMGAMLHPRIGPVDIKMLAEIRISWFLLFFTTVSCAAKQYEITGSVSLSMICMLIAHGVFANATAKGEHYVPATWDITYEKFGWMLCYWNIAGIPFTYSMQSVYLVEHGAPQLPNWYLLCCIALLLCAYYVWDTSQSQKNHFRLEFSGVRVTRKAFPFLPWQWLKNPRYITTAKGTPLLVDGWWRYARKIHYTSEIIMALVWGLACGFDNFIPYFYVLFFLSMITHRYFRDYESCARRYGKDWDRYVKEVPYAFIPGIL